MSPARPRPDADVVVVGGGWAGLAAAVDLVAAGRSVTVLESAPALGGRARGIDLRIGASTVRVDNGQHLLMGAYRETLALAARVGVTIARGENPSAPAELLRHPLRLRSVDGLRLSAAALPAPLHLVLGFVAARGLSWADRMSAGTMMFRLRSAGWRARPGETVAGLLTRHGQRPEVRRRLWEPLALGALNTPPAAGCATAFVNVLRDTLGADAAATDFVLPVGTLTDALPDPARRWLEARGARIALRTAARRLTPDGHGWRVGTDGGEIRADAVVLATPPWRASQLLSPLGEADPAARPLVEALSRLAPAAIATVYLAWPDDANLVLPAWVLLDDRPDQAAPGQWLFDRGTQQGLRLAAVVVSAVDRDAEASVLADTVARQVAHQLDLPMAAHARAVVERRATFLCTPDRPRLTADAFPRATPDTAPAWRSLALAGDHAWPDYPATLESAVRSGREAARVLLARHRSGS